MVVIKDTRRLSELIATAQGRAHLAVGKLAFDTQKWAQERAPIQTGFLKSSIKAEEMGPAKWRVAVYASYGPPVEFGSAAHDIVPKNKQALFWPGAAHPVKRVHHPGTSPKPFLTPAVEQARQEMPLAMIYIVNTARMG